jgi:hypothetical protein
MHCWTVFRHSKLAEHISGGLVSFITAKLYISTCSMPFSSSAENITNHLLLENMFVVYLLSKLYDLGHLLTDPLALNMSWSCLQRIPAASAPFLLPPIPRQAKAGTLTLAGPAVPHFPSHLQCECPLKYFHRLIPISLHRAQKMYSNRAGSETYETFFSKLETAKKASSVHSPAAAAAGGSYYRHDYDSTPRRAPRSSPHRASKASMVSTSRNVLQSSNYLNDMSPILGDGTVDPRLVCPPPAPTSYTSSSSYNQP